MLDDYASHAHVARRWLWPDNSHYLASDPWRENPALRLTPGDKRLVNWRRQLHDQVRVDGPGVYLPECLYHLDTLSSLDSRRQKVLRYDKLRGDRLPGLAGTVNAAWYLPEDRPDALHVLPVTEDDQALLDAVSAATRRPTTMTAGPSLELVNRQEVERVVEGEGPWTGASRLRTSRCARQNSRSMRARASRSTSRSATTANGRGVPGTAREGCVWVGTGCTRTAARRSTTRVVAS